jgi:UDP-hydrolysing UDP-N-acetyl-D-glucosamine 2-epimerase
MQIHVAYATTCRSDYGPAYWLLHDLLHDERFALSLLVGGAHLADGGRGTVSEIVATDVPIAARIPFDIGASDRAARGDAAATALARFAGTLAGLAPDVLLLYGDRLELLPIATAAVMTETPIAHLCGGDVTEGAIDDQVRHAVTKLSHLHFPATPRSADRILQMGEQAARVHVVGDPALDHFRRGERATAGELADHLGFEPDGKTLVVTLHPTTLDLAATRTEAKNLAAVLRRHRGRVVITAPAPDPGAEIVRAELESLAREAAHVVFVESLGSRRYRGLLAVAGAMIGNSSSGLIEAASVPLPVIDIGRRQRGRERAANVLWVSGEENEIATAVERALSPDLRESLVGLQNPYGTGHASEKIVDVLSRLPSREALLAKRFVDGSAPQSIGSR